MNYQITIPTTQPENQEKTHSFLVTEVQRRLFLAALNVAKQLHVPGDDDLDDAVRATVLLDGGAHFEGDWGYMEAKDEVDYDRQVNAFYDSVADLREMLDRNHHRAHWRMVG
jgi:hypothetical protein